MKTGFTPLWSSLSELTASTQVGNQRTFDIGYERETGTSAVIVYSGSPNLDTPKYQLFTASTNLWSGESALSGIGGIIESVRVIPQPESNELMVLMAETNQDLWSVLWDGTNDQFYSSAGQGLTEHEDQGSNDTDFWYDFEWDI